MTFQSNPYEIIKICVYNCLYTYTLDDSAGFWNASQHAQFDLKNKLCQTVIVEKNRFFFRVYWTKLNPYADGTWWLQSLCH